MSAVKVLVIANSPVTRENISGMLNGDPEVQIAGFADSGDNAKEKIAALSPDVGVMYLDSRNIDFVKSVLPQLTLPVVVVADTSTYSLNAVKNGPVDYVKMPILKTASTMESLAKRLLEQIKVSSNAKASPQSAPVAAAKPKIPEQAKSPETEIKAKAVFPADLFPAKKIERPTVDTAAKIKTSVDTGVAKTVSANSESVTAPVKSNTDTPESADSTSKALAAAAAAKQKLGGYATPKGKHHVIALGASTGGTDALHTVLQDLPTSTPGIVIVQHMPELFTKMYADRLNRACKMSCVEAVDGERVEVGKIILAAGNYHLRLAKDAKGYYVTSQHGEKVSGHCPSVDVLFESVAKVAGSDAIGAIFTGMGADGAIGLKKMRDAGAYTIGQDEKSCVVYGMPMVAYNMGGVCRQAPLDQIAQIILENC